MLIFQIPIYLEAAVLLPPHVRVIWMQVEFPLPGHCSYVRARSDLSCARCNGNAARLHLLIPNQLAADCCLPTLNV